MYSVEYSPTLFKIHLITRESKQDITERGSENKLSKSLLLD